jgi:hypothetical protein
VYGIVYFTVTTHGSAVVSHWVEDWEIYENSDDLFDVDAGGVLQGFNPLASDPLVEGFDAGMTHWKKFTWVGNGFVETATGPFAEWEGRRVHTEGSFAFPFGSGIVRFN